MEMWASEDVGRGQDITPPLSPLASSLYDAFLLSHCSSCFSPLPSLPLSFPHISHHVPSHSHSHPSYLYYCSPRCSPTSALAAAEHRLFHFSSSYSGDASDLRAALRLIYALRLPFRPGDRLRGLLTNLDHLISRGDVDEVVSRIREGAKAVSMARRLVDGADFSGKEECSLEEAALCAVITNAVEVRGEGGRGLGIAVYGTAFSWINHSCSPNACYRFVKSASMEATELGLRIVPAASGQDIDTDFSKHGELENGCQLNIPRIIVRSIKPIRRGEEVTVAYTDLLQPKALRQSELWLKYCFICSCRRCTSLSPSSVDKALQDTFTVACLESKDLSSAHVFYKDEDIEVLAEYIDNAISDYLSSGNPEHCCKKLGDILIVCSLEEPLEPSKGKLQLNFRLHPLHYLALNIYTTLASAYKTRVIDLPMPCSTNNDSQLEAFKLRRTGAAYSLLLAGATHYLFLSESSLIACAANFWTNAGESLLSLAQSSLWNQFVEWDLPLPVPGHSFCKCSLMGKTNLNFVGTEFEAFEDISRDFRDCVTGVTTEAWGFLAYNCHYLELFRDPINFSWLEGSDVWHSGGSCGHRASSRYDWNGYSNKQRENIYKLALHCLMYGGYLSSICYGCPLYWTQNVQNLYGL